MSEELNNTSFAEMIENSMKQINIKQVVKGTVVNINRKGEVIVDIGYKSDGIIPKDEYSYNFLGIMAMLAVGRGLAPKNSFFCSQWVATVLQEVGINLFDGKCPEDVRPFDFYGVLQDKIIYEGPVVEYPYYNDADYPGFVEDNRSKILIKEKQYTIDKRRYDNYARTKNT